MSDLRLEIVEGPHAGKKFPVREPLLIGRGRDAQLPLNDELVSRTHAKVTPVEGGLVIEDLGSTNGTFVNGDEIHGSVQIKPGDQVLVGVTVLQLRTPQEIAAQPSAVRPVPAAFVDSIGHGVGAGSADESPDTAPPGLAMAPKKPTYLPADVAKHEPKSQLDPLLDAITKGKARSAPIAVFVVAVIAILILLAQR